MDRFRANLNTCPASVLHRRTLVLDDVQCQLQPVRYAELLENVVQVVLDRLLADEQPLSDFLVQKALDNRAAISRSRLLSGKG